MAVSTVIVISSDSEDSDSTEILTDCDSILTFTPTKRQVALQFSLCVYRAVCVCPWLVTCLVTIYTLLYSPTSDVESDSDGEHTTERCRTR